ncbi:MAG: Rrf2 family transcriptional regulator [Phycisphaerales bacterium]|nr:MAG: Rrf2 family transcriptional regulator [Phycisphaerales bacterium]
MLSITRKTDYALIAMADLAKHHPSVVNTRDISERLRIPGPVLQKILTRLANEGLAVSIQGPKGGYRLSRPPYRISLAQVVTAIEGSFRLTACAGPQPKKAKRDCVAAPTCPISKPMRKVHNLLEQCLTAVNLAQLASDTVPHSVTLSAPAKRRKR